MSLSPILSLAKGALAANETALAVVGNNIANVHTPGYSRQVADFESNPPQPDASGRLIGSGTRVARVNQVVDPLLLRRLLGSTSDRGRESALRDRLDALAGVLNDVSEPALDAAVSGFFDAVDALARNPAGAAERQGLLGRAAALVGELNRRSQSIATLQRGVDDRVAAATRDANAELDRIASLNLAIAAAESGGQRANELRDDRQQALERLAGIIPVHTVEVAGGTVSVFAANGLTLVNAGTVLYRLAVQDGSAGLDSGPLKDVGFEDASGTFLSVSGGYPSGEIAGLLTARDTYYPSHSAALDTLANTLRDEVNAVQQAGIDLDGNSTAAVPLFGNSGVPPGAGNLTLLLDPNTDPSAPRKIAAALSTQPGDNQNALALADLRTRALAALGNVSFGSYVAGAQGRIGEDAARAADAARAGDLMQQQLENQRQSVSGVNLNEELADLIKFERAFQAASQMVRVTDTILEEVVNLLR